MDRIIVQVAKAGETAIKQIGSVVRNPEIQVISPSLIEALQNPTKKTSGGYRSSVVDPPFAAVMLIFLKIYLNTFYGGMIS